MFEVLKSRLKHGHKTVGYPKENPVFPPHFRGLPVIQSTPCADGCQACLNSCPTDAIRLTDERVSIDLGRCLFCPECQEACPQHLIEFSQDYRLATATKEDLLFSGPSLNLAKEFNDKVKKIFGRSLKLRQVSAGGCNGCEADLNVLNTVVFDLGRFGIQFVASPRHADGLVITGPVTKNMELALKKTYEAMPSPKIVIAVGACAISGGPYLDHPEVNNGAAGLVPIDLFIPGCPPHPFTILDGILRVLGKLPEKLIFTR